MNRQQTDKLTKRLDALEQRRTPEPVTVEWHLVVPGPDGPRLTGEIIVWRPER